MTTPRNQVGKTSSPYTTVRRLPLRPFVLTNAPSTPRRLRATRAYMPQASPRPSPVRCLVPYVCRRPRLECWGPLTGIHAKTPPIGGGGNQHGTKWNEQRAKRLFGIIFFPLSECHPLSSSLPLHSFGIGMNARFRAANPRGNEVLANICHAFMLKTPTFDFVQLTCL